MTKHTSTLSEAQPVTKVKRSTSAETALGFAVMGCLVAGAISLYKAANMTSGAGVLFCILSSIAAFGTVAFIYLRKD